MSILAPENDLYAILEIPHSADASQIKDSYRRLVRLNHPDANPGRQTECEAMMKSIIEAYNILSDPQRRERYDCEARLRAVNAAVKRSGKDTYAGYGEPPSMLGKIRYALGIAPSDFASQLGITDAALTDYEQRDGVPQTPVQFRTFTNLCDQAMRHLEANNDYAKAQDLRVALDRRRNQRRSSL